MGLGPQAERTMTLCHESTSVRLWCCRRLALASGPWRLLGAGGSPLTDVIGQLSAPPWPVTSTDHSQARPPP